MNDLSPIIIVLIATSITWFCTFLGALVICSFKNIHPKILNALLGLGAGVMIGSCLLSLLNKAIASTSQNSLPIIGFISGGFFVILCDLFLNKLLKKKNNVQDHKKSFLLVLAVSLHNFFEGLSIGVAFSSFGDSSYTLIGGVMLTLGIGLQNFIEGATLALPLKQANLSKKKCLLYGQISGVVEPIGGLIGALIIIHIGNIIPLLLAFSAGGILCVVTSEIIPEAYRKSKNLASIFVLIGFSLILIMELFF